MITGRLIQDTRFTRSMIPLDALKGRPNNQNEGDSVGVLKLKGQRVTLEDAFASLVTPCGPDDAPDYADPRYQLSAAEAKKRINMNLTVKEALKRMAPDYTGQQPAMLDKQADPDKPKRQRKRSK